MRTVVAIALLFPSAATAQAPSRNPPPPTPWIALDACPGEGCSLGTWSACTTVVARREKRRDAPVAFTLRRGERVTALRSDVHVNDPGIVVFRDTVTYVPPFGGLSGDTVRFGRADTLYLLNYLGEGYLVWWFRGRADTGQIFWPSTILINASAPRSAVLIRSADETQWALVRNAQGEEGWLEPSMDIMAGGAPHYGDGPERCSPE